MGNTHAEFADYVKGKSVAFLGRSETALFVRQGDFIDSHDIVARVTYPAYLNTFDETADKECKGIIPVEFVKFLGCRTDIFYSNLQAGSIDKYVQGMKQLKDTGGEWIVIANLLNIITGALWSLPLYDMIKTILPTRICPMDDYLDLVRALVSPRYSYPVIGTAAINDLLQHDIKSLYITGVTNWAAKKEDPGLIEQFEYTTQDNFDYVQKLIRNDPRITVDDTMKELYL